MIKVVLWDIDGTLLDFLAAEREAIRACFEAHGLGECTDDMIRRYSAVNRKYWARLERGEITKREVLIGRFLEFFKDEGLPTQKAEAFNDEYQIRLGDTIVFKDGGYELVKDLKERGYLQYAVTNGTKTAQRKKMKASGLESLFDGIFISDEIGIEKPMKGFFDVVLGKIASYSPDEILIVGDSLSSDIRGGNNAGILCCWYNPGGAANETELRIDFEISDLRRLYEVLDNMK